MLKPSFIRVLTESLPALAAVGIGSTLGLIPYTVAAISHPDYRLFALKDPTALMGVIVSASLGIALYDVALHRLIFRPMCRRINRVLIAPWLNRRASAAKAQKTWSKFS